MNLPRAAHYLTHFVGPNPSVLSKFCLHATATIYVAAYP